MTGTLGFFWVLGFFGWGLQINSALLSSLSGVGARFLESASLLGGLLVL